MADREDEELQSVAEGQSSAAQVSTDSSDNSDAEPDTFEDAPDSKPLPQPSHQVPRSATSRSLTDRRPSSSSTTNSSQAAPVRSSTPDTPAAVALDGAVDRGSPRPSKSPLLTGHRISTASLDDVNLEEVAPDDVSTTSRSSTIRSKDSTRPTPLLTKEPTTATTSANSRSFSGALPTMPWASSANHPPHLPSSAAPPPRKLTSPFSWLSRNTSNGAKDASSPPLSIVSNIDRRHTASSVATLGSNPDLMVNKLEDTQESDSMADGARRGSRGNLRDRFKMLRMREEAGIASLGEETSASPIAGSAIAGLIGRSTGLGLGVGSPTSLADEKEGGLANQSAAPSSSLTETTPVALSSTTNPQLAPGMAAGATAGPSVMQGEDATVDWDLWQSVVYEGPAAVARTSAHELNRAIALGIPSAIRGVVWQVLAQSKNEELEGVYRELVNRGTDKDQDRSSEILTPTSSSAPSARGDNGNGHLNGVVRDKDSVPSSASSVRSGQSTPMTSTANGVASPTNPPKEDAEAMLKLKTTLAAEKKRKAAEDAAALQKLEKAIKRDLGSRTSYSKYAASAKLQEGLFGVCKAYALFDETVGYAQGMNFVIMPLLFNMPEEEAFCLLVRLMNQYHLRDMFIPEMPGLHLHIYQFERLLEDLEPALYCHLHRRGVSPQLYATPWFLTLFAYRFPLQLVLRIYDLVLSEGLEGAILKFAVVLMQKNAEALLGMEDMTTLTTFLKEKVFDVYIDQTPSATSILESGFFGSTGGSDKEVYRADALVQDACAVKLRPEMLKGYTAEWEEKMRQDKEREAEVEALRAANATFALKVRSLEERAEKFDTEHVQVASELVRAKVENEELRDSNESLTGQVSELRSVVEKQPGEIEAQLKDEMDRIMKRNLEVHNENRALEEQMTEMEKDLVNAKMQYAEINSAHESLKQRWNDLRKALGD
ncbi:MAG: GTPase-activating protein [Caeruleum heppii]|nr:MAG: GTPase-activating protein [Caeruleum heppii]